MRIGEVHRPLRILVCDELRGRILSRVYPPGTRLVEEHLAEELAVSRNPVREALRVLEAEGFVEIVPRRGAVVASLSVSSSQELYEMLLSLETMAVEFAARKVTPHGATRLLDVVARAEAALASRDFATLAEISSEFHVVVLQMAQNQHLEWVLLQLRSRNVGFSHIGPPAVGRLAWLFAQEDGARGAVTVAEHRELAGAIAAGDAALAVHLSRTHLEAALAAYSTLARSERELELAPLQP